MVAMAKLSQTKMGGLQIKTLTFVGSLFAPLLHSALFLDSKGGSD